MNKERFFSDHIRIDERSIALHKAIAVYIRANPELINIARGNLKRWMEQFPDAPESLLQSMEVDIFPKNKPELADLIDASIGELSMFHRTFAYYAHGVGKETAILPKGWEKRLIPINTENTLLLESTRKEDIIQKIKTDFDRFLGIRNHRYLKKATRCSENSFTPLDVYYLTG